MGLWLVARRLLAGQETYVLGSTLARRSLAAAQRHSDRRFARSIISEWIKLASARGDEKMVSELNEQLP